MLTNAELAILTLVCERPRHGYEIERVIEERGVREWTEVGFSSIYYLLKKLERKGLVSAHPAPGGRGPARMVYRSTAAGRTALREEALQALASTTRPSSPLQLGLANLPGLPPAEALKALERHRKALNDRLQRMRQRRDAQRPVPYYVEAMFAHGETVGEAELRWLEAFIRQVKRRASASPANPAKEEHR